MCHMIFILNFNITYFSCSFTAHKFRYVFFCKKECFFKQMIIIIIIIC